VTLFVGGLRGERGAVLLPADAGVGGVGGVVVGVAGRVCAGVAWCSGLGGLLPGSL
jgi:hypothetical protein